MKVFPSNFIMTSVEINELPTHQEQISYFVIFSTKPTLGSGAKIGCAIYTSTSNRKFLMTQMLSVSFTTFCML